MEIKKPELKIIIVIQNNKYNDSINIKLNPLYNFILMILKIPEATGSSASAAATTATQNSSNVEEGRRRRGGPRLASSVKTEANGHVLVLQVPVNGLGHANDAGLEACPPPRASTRQGSRKHG